jgi:hypothetical protein
MPVRNFTKAWNHLPAAAAIGLVLTAAGARADEALPCDHPKILIKLQNGYTPADANMQFKVADVHEVAYGAPPKLAAAVMDKSRYCEARIALANGKSDPVYYRLNVLKGGIAQDWVEPCFKSLNDKVMKDGCVDDRPPKK